MGVTLGPAMTVSVIVVEAVFWRTTSPSVAVTVTVNEPVALGVPVIVVVVEPLVGESPRPAGKPLAVHVQQGGLVGSVSVAVNVAPGYGAVASPLGTDDGGVTVRNCPLAAPAHTIIATTAAAHLIDKRIMAGSRG